MGHGGASMLNIHKIEYAPPTLALKYALVKR